MSHFAMSNNQDDPGLVHLFAQSHAEAIDELRQVARHPHRQYVLLLHDDVKGTRMLAGGNHSGGGSMVAFLAYGVLALRETAQQAGLLEQLDEVLDLLDGGA